MPDLISIATLALSLIKTAGEQLNKLRERAQTTKDLEIKEHVGSLYDTLNALKEAVSRLVDENKEQKRQLDELQHPPEEPKIKQVGETNYYFVGEEGPYCQPCYDVDPKAKRLVALSPQEVTSWGSIRRSCPVCRQAFYEK